MNDVTTVAIAKGIKKALVEQASSNLDAGTYPVNDIIHMQGSIRKAEDKEQICHMNIPYARLALALLSKVNKKTREKTIDEAIEAIENLSKELEDEIKSEVKGSWERLTDKARKITAGKVTCKLTFEIVSPDLVDAEVMEDAEEA